MDKHTVLSYILLVIVLANFFLFVFTVISWVVFAAVLAGAGIMVYIILPHLG